MDIRALKAELTTDPLGLGYAAAKTPTAMCALLNVKRNVARTSLTPVELWENTEFPEYRTLSQPDRDAYQAILTLGIVDITAGSKSRTTLLALFAAGSTTRANLVAFAGKSLQASRAETLGLGVVAEGNVIDAQALEAANGKN
jgi:hypothetical protein